MLSLSKLLMSRAAHVLSLLPIAFCSWFIYVFHKPGLRMLCVVPLFIWLLTVLIIEKEEARSRRCRKEVDDLKREYDSIETGQRLRRERIERSRS